MQNLEINEEDPAYLAWLYPGKLCHMLSDPESNFSGQTTQDVKSGAIYAHRPPTPTTVHTRTATQSAGC